jgi:hypothetical protein
MTGPDVPALTLKALALVIKAVRKRSGRPTQDKLVAGENCAIIRGLF